MMEVESPPRPASIRDRQGCHSSRAMIVGRLSSIDESCCIPARIIVVQIRRESHVGVRSYNYRSIVLLAFHSKSIFRSASRRFILSSIKRRS